MKEKEIFIDFYFGRFSTNYGEDKEKLQSGRKELNELRKSKKREFDNYQLAVIPSNDWKLWEQWMKQRVVITTPQEDERLNLAFRSHYLKSIAQPEKYGNSKYNGFLFEDGRKQFEQLYNEDHEPLKYLKKELARVDEFLTANRKFKSVDYSKEVLDEWDIVKIIHYEQVKEYYSFLNTLTNSNPQETATTLITNLTSHQLAKLRKTLIDQKFIAEIKLNDFTYLFSGNTIRNAVKIKWIKPKGRKMLVCLLDSICRNFDWPTANRCFEVTGKKLHGKDRRKVGYEEIENILKLCD